jgi:hypothetical protein
MGPCVLSQGTAQVNFLLLTYGAVLTVERSTALVPTNTAGQTVESWTNAAGKTHTFVNTNAPPRAFYRVHSTR